MIRQNQKQFPEGWRWVRLGEVIEDIFSGGTPNTKIEEYYNGNILWLNSKEVKNNRIYTTERTITEYGLEHSNAKWVKSNSVIIAMYGTTASMVAVNKIPLTTNQACAALEIDSIKADYNYIFYALLAEQKNLKRLSSGVAQQNLNLSIIKDFQIPLPPLLEQKAIAEVLSSLNDKIELLQEQNKTLEEMAQTLFRKWFIDNPERKKWKKVRLVEVVETKLGGTPSTRRPEYWGGNVSWINSGELNNFRIYRPTKYITELGLKNSATKLLPQGTTVIAITGATLGKVSLLEIDTCANQSVVGIIPNDKFPREFIYLWIKYISSELVLKQTGGAQQHINKNDINNSLIIVPPGYLMKKAVDQLKNIFDKISVNIRQVRILEGMRNLLLPKLINGEVRVKI